MPPSPPPPPPPPLAPPDSHAGDSHAADSHAGDSHAGDSHAGDSHAGYSHAAEPNPCKGGTPEDEKPPIWTALANLPCEHESAKVQPAPAISRLYLGCISALSRLYLGCISLSQVQSGADVTVGSAGEMAAGLQPIAEAYTGLGMCAVNVHWHLGAEHRNAGTYDLSGKAWFEENMPDAGKGLTDGEYRLRHNER